jgi:chromosome segregation ATPase
MTEFDYKKIEDIVARASTEAATKAVAQMREFHQADLQVLRERIDIGFEAQDRRMDSLEGRMDSIEVRMGGLEGRMGTFERDMVFVKDKLQEHDERFDRIETALATLLKEFQADREKVAALEAQVAELIKRVAVLERQLAATSL